MTKSPTTSTTSTATTASTTTTATTATATSTAADPALASTRTFISGTPAALPDVGAPPPRPPSPAFTPGQIAAAALAGTPVAGALLAAWNLRALERRAAAALVLGGAVLAIALAVALDARFAALSLRWTHPTLAALAWAAAHLAFNRSTPPRRWGFVVVACAAAWAGLLGAGAAAAALFPRAVPSVGELFLHEAAAGPVTLRWDDGATREDARRILDAVAHDPPVGGRLVGDALRSEDGGLVVRVRLPDTGPPSRDGAGRLVTSVAEHIQPPECVTVRVVATSGKTAERTVCPSTVR